MADYTTNIAKGRVVELYNRVKANEPANSALILVPLKAKGTESEAQDYDTLTELLAGTADEQTEGGWVRKTLTDAQLAALPAPNDTGNKYEVLLPAVTWTTPEAGKNTTGLAVCYDADTTGGTDSNIIPLTVHDFVVTADGNNVTLDESVFYADS